MTRAGDSTTLKPSQALSHKASRIGGAALNGSAGAPTSAHDPGNGSYGLRGVQWPCYWRGKSRSRRPRRDPATKNGVFRWRASIGSANEATSYPS